MSSLTSRFTSSVFANILVSGSELPHSSFIVPSSPSVSSGGLTPEAAGEDACRSSPRSTSPDIQSGSSSRNSLMTWRAASLRPSGLIRLESSLRWSDNIKLQSISSASHAVR